MAQREGFEPPREIPTGFQGRRYTRLSDLCPKKKKAQAKVPGLNDRGDQGVLPTSTSHWRPSHISTFVNVV